MTTIDEDASPDGAPELLAPPDPFGLVRWHLRRSKNPVDRLRLAAIVAARSRLQPRERRRAVRRYLVANVIVGPLSQVRKRGRRAQRDGGVGRVRQWARIVRGGLRLQLRPRDFYNYRLYASQSPTPRDLVPRPVLKVWVYGWLHTGLDVGKVAPVTNKLRFAEVAASAGLPHIPVIAVFEAGRTTWLDPELVTQDLFAKPIDRRGGTGAAAYRFDAETSTYIDVRTGRVRTLASLEKRYAKRSHEMGYLLSPRISNHESLVPLAGDALSTVRVIAMRNEQDEVEVVAAVLRMAAKPGAVVDNGHRGGLAAAVDLCTGELSRGFGLKAATTQGAITHPISGRRIEGHQLPHWPQVIELACQAQETFRPRKFAGWDIALTDDGPLLVEGNSRPGVDLIQQTHGPLGAHRLGQLLAWHCSQRLGIEQ